MASAIWFNLLFFLVRQFRILYFQSTVTFLASIKLYCLVTEAHVSEQLAESCYVKVYGHESTHDLLITGQTS